MKEFQYQHDGLPVIEEVKLVERIYHSLNSIFPDQKPTTIRIVGIPVQSNGMIFQYKDGFIAVVHANYKASRKVGPYEHEVVPVRGFISVKVFPNSNNDLVSKVEESIRNLGLMPIEREDFYI